MNAMPNIEMTPVKSSQIYSIGYCADTHTLAVQFFHSGAPGNAYHYQNFTAEDFAAFAGAESVGKHFYKNIKPFADKYPFKNMGVPAAAAVAAAVALIGPVPVERDADGWWSHPRIPAFDEGQEDAYRAWIKAQGLVTDYATLESEGCTHPAYVAYFDEAESSVVGWTPAAPAGDGWFTISIHDTESGPVWVWARRVAAGGAA
ncbi:KTSC domain-containing protein [Massilia antarctica]|uniref:KTSC domain-containing protein n=1 Tax=Massilia antarctica TaxID=2765360 RepID=UPI0022717003|nr:KTSC domain-containing protein [Massilia sp. H27-R4]MCY0910903.1 KTSC domain-containing protein [Massilia sp. H27-R4]